MRFIPGGRPGPADSAPSDLAWRVIGLVNLYRLLVAGGLFIASRIDAVNELLIIPHPTRMAVICAISSAFHPLIPPG